VVTKQKVYKWQIIIKNMKKAIFGRHGTKGKDGNLVDKTISSCYEKGRKIFEGLTVKPEEAYIRHTIVPRTGYTAKAVMAGAFNVHPSPKKQGDLDKSELIARIDGGIGPGIDVSNLRQNEEVFERLGIEGYLNLLTEYPDMRELEGVEITSWGEILHKAKEDLPKAMKDLQGKKIGATISHITLIDSTVIQLINTGREKPIKKPQEIGGWFDMEEMAILEIENLKGKLELRGERYPIDLSQL